MHCLVKTQKKREDKNNHNLTTRAIKVDLDFEPKWLEPQPCRLQFVQVCTTRDPLPDEILNFQPTVRNLQSSRRGAAAGPSGMTTEHLRPLFLVAEAQILDIATRMIRDGRFALSKLDGGVRGIVAGDVIRRLVARSTMAQQSQKAVEVATALFQYALSTKAGCECVAHALPGLTHLHLDTTIKSIDGISAFDLISRESILTGLTRVDRSEAALPFVRLAFVAAQRQLCVGERLLAFLDDIHLATAPGSTKRLPELREATAIHNFCPG